MEKLIAFLKDKKITEVECVISDMTGIARGKISPVDKFVNEKGMRLPESVLLQTVTGDNIGQEVYFELLDSAEIDFICVPDENAVFLLPWTLEATAQVIHDTFDRMGNPIELSPRNVLKKVIKLYDDHGWQPVIAPEMEFYLVARNEDPDLPLKPPMGRSGRAESGRQSFSIDAANEYDPLFEDMYEWCEAQGLDIDTLIHEEGTAQMEINFSHGDALSLADQVFVFKRTLREAALKHNVCATFMAKPVTNEPGSAMHIHQNVLDKTSGKNIFTLDDGTKSPLFLSHIAGLQRYLPEFLPLVAPSVNSFRRFLPGTSAPVNLEWGEENRTCGLRIPESPPHTRRIENRLAGADANCYLAVAASLLAGYIGMVEGLKPSNPVHGKANESRTANVNCLPLTLDEALVAMEESEACRKYLGDAFTTGYVAVKQAELENFRRVVSAWEREFLLLTV
ncbi:MULTISPECIES: glutamine synthetase family protein [Shewanella]|uniref:Glutamine synthetase n=2 Tax=Shewanella TaxID=22 RepID=A0A975ALT1_9GAMM|nr:MULTISPECIES: glutamine synthetase family protein [Shewanella]QSX30722.1 glutamine synthetase [Shewanella cyperi]QSX37936.1 glutamine synthetase [Shewanella sedimentimangrovi]QSX41500.1 glutamine synthetase [Shewanella cyperi]